MKILMLSRDPKIFEENSEVRSRMLEYAKSVDELHVVIFTKFQIPNDKLQTNSKIQISKNLFMYQAKHLWDIYKIGKTVVGNWKLEIGNYLLTSQDPFETGLIGYFLKRRHKIPLELQVHTDFLSPYFWRESFKNKIRVIIAKYLIPRADKIRVVSERIKNSILRSSQDLRSCDDQNIEVRPIFVDEEKIKNTPIKTDLHKKYPGKFIILMASRLTKEKNIFLAIAAMQETVKKYPKTLLLIVGEGPEREALKFKVESLRLQDNVIFEPWTDDLFSYYKTADLFLITSNYEGYGRTAIEAQAAGLPVLMTDVGVAIGEVVPVGDLTALTQKLSEIIQRK
jgi:glycosyltransferase involved in cell wall biosynthesis